MSDAAPADPPISAGDILTRTFHLLRRGALRAAIAIVLLAAPGIVIDAGLVTGEGESAMIVLGSFLPIAMQFWLTGALLEELGCQPSGRLRFPAFFLLGIVTSLGIVLGLVLLVVPGIVLIVRWSISAPILLGSDERAIDAIRLSWRATEGRFWPILGAFLAIYAPAFLLVAAAYALQYALPSPIPAVIMANILLQGCIIAGWHAAIAIYSLVRDPTALSRIFE